MSLSISARYAKMVEKRVQLLATRIVAQLQIGLHSDQEEDLLIDRVVREFYEGADLSVEEMDSVAVQDCVQRFNCADLTEKDAHQLIAQLADVVWGNNSIEAYICSAILLRELTHSRFVERAAANSLKARVIRRIARVDKRAIKQNAETEKDKNVKASGGATVKNAEVAAEAAAVAVVDATELNKAVAAESGGTIKDKLETKRAAKSEENPLPPRSLISGSESSAAVVSSGGGGTSDSAVDILNRIKKLLI